MKNAYPRWLHPHQTLDGSKRIVKDALEEERYTGVKMNADGSVFDDPGPKPPTLEEVIAAGYPRETAEKIVDEEKYKFAAGYPPYGTNEPPAPQPDAAIHTLPVPEAVPEVVAEPASEVTATLQPVEDHEAIADALNLG